MRRIASLPPSRTHEVASAGNLEHGVEQQMLSSAGDETGPELAQDGGVEAQVGEGQGQGQRMKR